MGVLFVCRYMWFKLCDGGGLLKMDGKTCCRSERALVFIPAINYLTLSCRFPFNPSLGSPSSVVVHQ